MKVIVYLPSVITAASVSVLFKSFVFPVRTNHPDFEGLGRSWQELRFYVQRSRKPWLISTILWWMWFGNTTLLLISGVLGIDPGLSRLLILMVQQAGKIPLTSLTAFETNYVVHIGYLRNRWSSDV